MKRSYLLAALLLILLGILFDLRLSAHDNDQPASAIEAVQAVDQSDVAKLMAKIEALEKRIVALERTRPLVRQADSRDTETLELLTPPELTPQAPPSRPRVADDRKINGTTWSFKLLGDKKPVRSPNAN